jgi:hypothetical protein
MRCLWGFLLAAGLASGASGASISYELNVEFDNGETGAFAQVDVTETAEGGLEFEIGLLEALGEDADLHKFYFNVRDTVVDLDLASDDNVSTAYTLSEGPAIAGGAGSDFDYGISFGNGAGRRGNGVLQTARFTLTASSTLRIEDLDELSSTSSGVIATSAAHVQGTSLSAYVDSETVGGVILPEPGINALLVLIATALVARRRSRHERSVPT